jgi:cytochrome c551/c552
MSEHKAARWVYLLTGGVLLLGTVLVVVGTRTSRGDDARVRHVRQDSVLDETCPPVSGAPGLLERGAALQRMECAGCHANDRREIGPSYQMIAARYRCSPRDLSMAFGHPAPGWADYPPGPAGRPMARDDQAALVHWILNTEGREDE